MVRFIPHHFFAIDIWSRMKTIISVLFVLLSYSISAQGKYDKLIESGNYAKANKKISKKLRKDTLALDCIYSLALLLNQKDYEGYSTYLAYYNANRIDMGLSKLGERQRSEFESNGLNFKAVKSLKEQVASNAYNDILDSNNVAQYNRFLTYFDQTLSKYQKDAITLKIYTLEFESAKATGTVGAYDQFLERYPKAPQKEMAIKFRNRKAFDNAKEENTAQAFKVFIHTYPNSELVGQAWQYVYKMEYEKVSRSTDYRTYVWYMREYPESPFYDAAYGKYERYLYEEKTKEGTLDAYISFIQDYPNNSFRNEAIQKAFTVGARSNDFLKLKYVAEKLARYGQINAIVNSMYNLVRQDGRSYVINKFVEEYGEYLDDFLVEEDLEIAYRYDALELLNISFSNYSQVETFVRDAAPRMIGLKALTSMARNAIDAQNWQEAARIFRKYEQEYKSNKAFVSTLQLLEDKVTDDIKKSSISDNVNTSNGSEYLPVMTANGRELYFCARNRDDNLGGEDIFVSRREGFEWSYPTLLSDLNSSYNNEAPLSLTVDGTRLTLFESGVLHESYKTVEGWSESEKMSEVLNRGQWNADVCYTGDGQAIMFTSKREGGYNYVVRNDREGRYPTDIYVSVRNDQGEWQEPINLGPVINTPYTERTPFLHPDMKTLYFSSNGHGGLGDLDVFMCTRLREDSWTEWSEPVNLGKYFNTSGSNWGYKITTDGKKAYFSEQEDAEIQNFDIISVNLPPRLRPDLVATVKGTLKDRNDDPLGAKLLIEDLNSGEVVAEANSDPSDGEFFVVLPLGKIYGYHVDKDEYYPISGNIDLRETEESVEKLDNIKMVTFEELIREGLAVPINNLFFEFNKSELLSTSKPELKRVAKILLENQLMIRIEGHTDNVGSDEYNYKLSLERCNAVRRYLISLGCSPDQMETVGFGSKNPIASNDTDAGRAQNRRVELRFIPK